MTDGLMGLFALAYSGLVLFTLASSLRKLMPPVRAALAAFALSAIVHGATTLLMGENMQLLLILWGVPHLLLLPALLWAARRQSSGS